MKNKTHVVIVSSWFYPQNRVACYRMNSFAKYLDHDRFDISIVTLLSDKNLPMEEQIFDCKVMRVPSNKLVKIRQQVTTDNWLVHQVKSLNNVLVGQMNKEDYPGWAKNATDKLLDLHEHQPIDVIISSYAPMDAHLATLNFKLKYPEVKWVADMRDEMSMNPFLSTTDKKDLRSLELKLAKKIDALTSVSKPILNDFAEIMAGNEIKFVEVRNGFDHDKQPYGNFNEQFTMLYAGTFYGKRKPDTFFSALSNLLEQGKLSKEWKLQLLGTHKNFQVPKELSNNLEFLPTADNEAAVDMMFKADCNVLIHPPMGVKGVFTGKLFEYISANKPVLALVDKSDVAAELIEEQNAGFIADFYSIDEIEEAILDAYATWKEKRTLPFNADKVKTLHRKHQAKIMESVIEKILN